MQHHALALAESGVQVVLVCEAGTPPLQAVQSHPAVRIRELAPPPVATASAERRSLWALRSLAHRAAEVSRALSSGPAPDALLVQNSPTLPTLPIAWIASRARGARLAVDWHDTGEPVLAPSRGGVHPAVPAARWLERVVGRRADLHLCVSEAMRTELASRWDVHGAVVLRDRPDSGPGASDPAEREALIGRERWLDGWRAAGLPDRLLGARS